MHKAKSKQNTSMSSTATLTTEIVRGKQNYISISHKEGGRVEHNPSRVG